MMLFGAISTATDSCDSTEPTLTYTEPDSAYQRAREVGGCVTVADVEMPSDSNATTVKVTPSIYYSTGKIAYSAKTENTVIPNEWIADYSNADSRPVVFYWNEYTNDDRKAPGGTYRYEIEEEENDETHHDEGYLYLDGPEDRSQRRRNCGAGMHLALVPLILVSAINHHGRHKRKKATE
ncbi:MAG: hypothetical protein GF418_01260 [Chitinivibrionales bacterium]|nr:hypothetical protein [Chitinivibrionales bacterium]MBD3394230.1 hypothetical protein [Chitinivibrionales bacterium]